MSDFNIYETNRNCTRTRAATQTSRGTAKPRPRNLPSRSNSRSITQLGGSLARCLQKRRSQCPKQQAASPSAMQALAQTASKTLFPATERADSTWLQNPIMDSTACSRFDNKTFRSNLPHLSGLADLKSPALKLPEAQTKGPPARRTSHCKLAQKGLAAYKKKPIKAVKSSFLLMKAALCFSLWYVEPGLQGVKLRCFTSGKVTTSSRPSVLLVLRLFVIGWVCILILPIQTSAPMILRHLCRHCLSVLAVGLSWLLTAGLFIVGLPGDCKDDFAGGFRLNGCQLMHQSLILWREFGITASTVTLPIMFLMIFSCSGKLPVSRSVICKPSKLCFDLFSKRPDSKYDLFH